MIWRAASSSRDRPIIHSFLLHPLTCVGQPLSSHPTDVPVRICPMDLQRVSRSCTMCFAWRCFNRSTRRDHPQFSVPVPQHPSGPPGTLAPLGGFGCLWGCLLRLDPEHTSHTVWDSHRQYRRECKYSSPEPLPCPCSVERHLGGNSTKAMACSVGTDGIVSLVMPTVPARRELCCQSLSPCGHTVNAPGLSLTHARDCISLAGIMCVPATHTLNCFCACIPLQEVAVGPRPTVPNSNVRPHTVIAVRCRKRPALGAKPVIGRSMCSRGQVTKIGLTKECTNASEILNQCIYHQINECIWHTAVQAPCTDRGMKFFFRKLRDILLFYMILTTERRQGRCVWGLGRRSRSLRSCFA